MLLGLTLGIPGTAITVSAETATLNEIRVGNHGAYIRIVFELSSQAQYQLEEDTAANRISVQFLGANTTLSEKPDTPQSGCLEGLTTLKHDNYVSAYLNFNSGWNKLNPFILREPDRMVLDVFCGEGISTDRSQTDNQVEQAAQIQVTTSEDKPESPEPISALTNKPQVETETQPTVAKKPSEKELTTPSALETESQMQGANLTNSQAVKPLTTIAVAPKKKDPFQRYLLILLAAITGIIILLIALIVVQKKSQSAGVDDDGDTAPAEPDETMRAIDKQIKAQLMKYDQ